MVDAVLTSFSFFDDDGDAVEVGFGDTVYFDYTTTTDITNLSVLLADDPDNYNDLVIYPSADDPDGDGSGSFVIDGAFTEGTWYAYPSIIVQVSFADFHIYRADGNIYDIFDNDIGDHDIDFSTLTFAVTGDGGGGTGGPTPPVLTSFAFSDADGGAVTVAAGDTVSFSYTLDGAYINLGFSLNDAIPVTDGDGGGSGTIAIDDSWATGSYTIDPSLTVLTADGAFFFRGDVDGDGDFDITDALDNIVGSHEIDIAALFFTVTEPNGSVAITDDDGTPEAGDTLTAVLNDPDGLGAAPASYQWFKGGEAINGATSDSYKTNKKDKGETFSVEVTYTDDIGYTETVSADIALTAGGGGGPGGGGGGGGSKGGGKPDKTAKTSLEAADSFAFSVSTGDPVGEDRLTDGLPPQAASQAAVALDHLPADLSADPAAPEGTLPDWVDALFV